MFGSFYKHIEMENTGDYMMNITKSDKSEVNNTKVNVATSDKSEVSTTIDTSERGKYKNG